MHIFEKKKNHEFAVTFPIYTYVILQGVYFDFTLVSSLTLKILVSQNNVNMIIYLIYPRDPK